jgi:hypothetical protein
MKLHIPRLTIKEDGVETVTISMDKNPLLYTFISLAVAFVLPIMAVLCAIILIMMSFGFVILAGTSIIKYIIIGVRKIIKK